MVINSLINSSNYECLKNFLSSKFSGKNNRTCYMFVIMEVVCFDYFFFLMHSNIVFFAVLLPLLFILILMQVDRP